MKKPYIIAEQRGNADLIREAFNRLGVSPYEIFDEIGTAAAELTEDQVEELKNQNFSVHPDNPIGPY